MANEKPTTAVKYKLNLPEGKVSIAIKGLGEVTPAHIEGPDGAIFIKAIKTLDQKDKGKRFDTYIKQVQ